ncbi:hypothetical protein BN8_00774 [Fibrisoma limi BUZ 3]|uniref:DUF4153 domain-containing protein n=1 Tax=Fibrisoma limi BUZ 3 TaxID=1185876 RepID=I2GD49_9BACT|nr:hypothetical protein [Fibrisoma limi]CCH51823.1 hypothetical protein BN8_00774 [Fibrisoma limi BUZ 3]
MKEAILNNLDNPRQLEVLYRDNQTAFTQSFNSIYEELKNNKTVAIWYERLNYASPAISKDSTRDLTFTVIASVLAGLFAKLPELLAIDEEYFYSRNIAFIVLPLLMAYFLWTQKSSVNKLIGVASVTLISLLYINKLPVAPRSDTLILACIHLPLFLWTLLGFSFVGDRITDSRKRLDFLRYNGDLAVMMALIAIAGFLFTAITIGLFKSIQINIGEFYGRYVVVFGVSAAPFVGTYLVRTNPQLVGRVSPVIARLFTPLALLTVIAFLIAIVTSGKDPFKDRDFLIVFNLLLIGVMALILFSVAESSKAAVNRNEVLLLFVLALTTIIVNGIALSAILYRITEWGITPNRLAVLGGNVLILVNLILVTRTLFQAIRSGQNGTTLRAEVVGNVIAGFLPVYSLWTVVVTFLFPVLFDFK